jgi:MoxR-like ATPase
MNEKFIKINNKTVQLSEPYEAVVSEIIGREQEMTKILASWMGANSGLPLAPLLVGEPGLGKNRIVYECTRMCSKKLYIFQGHEDVTAEDLICASRFSDDPERKVDYIVSPLITAMIKGGVCFIDEISKIRPRALAPLSSLLDERRYLDSITLGERIYAHPGFRFIAATNTSDLEVNMLPDFIRSRMRPVIAVDYPRKEEIDMIIKTHFLSLNNNGKSLIELFWKLWNSRYANKTPEPRDSIQIFGFAINLADYEYSEGTIPLFLENKNIPFCLKESHLEKAFEVYLESPWSKK